MRPRLGQMQRLNPRNRAAATIAARTRLSCFGARAATRRSTARPSASTAPGLICCCLLCVHLCCSPVDVRLGHKKACRAVQKQRKAAQEQEKLTGHTCDVCGVPSPELFACPACGLTHYCSKEHQHDLCAVRVTYLTMTVQARAQESLPTSCARANRRSTA